MADDNRTAPVNVYRQNIWDSFPEPQEERWDTPATRAAFWDIWQQITGAEAEGAEVSHG